MDGDAFWGLPEGLALVLVVTPPIHRASCCA